MMKSVEEIVDGVVSLELVVVDPERNAVVFSDAKQEGVAAEIGRLILKHDVWEKMGSPKVVDILGYQE